MVEEVALAEDVEGEAADRDVEDVRPVGYAERRATFLQIARSARVEQRVPLRDCPGLERVEVEVIKVKAIDEPGVRNGIR